MAELENPFVQKLEQLGWTVELTRDSRTRYCYLVAQKGEQMVESKPMFKGEIYHASPFFQEQCEALYNQAVQLEQTS